MGSSLIGLNKQNFHQSCKEKIHLSPNVQASLDLQKCVSEHVNYIFIMLILHPTGQNISNKNLSKGNKIF